MIRQRLGLLITASFVKIYQQIENLWHEVVLPLEKSCCPRKWYKSVLIPVFDLHMAPKNDKMLHFIEGIIRKRLEILYGTKILQIH
jgi:hypothetical protein